MGHYFLGVSSPSAPTALSSQAIEPVYAVSTLPGFDRLTQRVGPHGLDCSCDLFDPCEDCATREQIEEAQAQTMFNRIEEIH